MMINNGEQKLQFCQHKNRQIFAFNFSSWYDYLQVKADFILAVCWALHTNDLLFLTHGLSVIWFVLRPFMISFSGKTLVYLRIQQVISEGGIEAHSSRVQILK